VKYPSFVNVVGPDERLDGQRSWSFGRAGVNEPIPNGRDFLGEKRGGFFFLMQPTRRDE
jgi:hypothetical protein